MKVKTLIRLLQRVNNADAIVSIISDDMTKQSPAQCVTVLDINGKDNSVALNSVVASGSIDGPPEIPPKPTFARIHIEFPSNVPMQKQIDLCDQPVELIYED